MRAFLSIFFMLAGCAAMEVPSAPLVTGSAVVADIQVGRPPTMLAIAPDGKRLYAASNGSISIIDTTANTVVMTISHVSNSTGIAIASDGAKAYVTNLQSIDLTVIDTTTEALGDTVTMSLQRARGGYGSLAVSPDNQTVYVANRVNQALGIVDLASGRSKLLNPTVWPVDVAISPDGKTIYGAGCKQICTPGYVQVYDVPAGRFTEQIQVEGNPYRIVLSPDGANAYVANLSGPSISFVDLASRAVSATVSVAPQPTGLGTSPDGSTLYVASQTSGILSIVDVATAVVSAQLPIHQARDIAVSPDGQRVYVSAGNKVLVVDARRISP